jgi:hypothetical protein
MTRTIMTIKKIVTNPEMTATTINVDFEIDQINDVVDFKKKLKEFQLHIDGQTRLK